MELWYITGAPSTDISLEIRCVIVSGNIAPASLAELRSWRTRRINRPIERLSPCGRRDHHRAFGSISTWPLVG